MALFKKTTEVATSTPKPAAVKKAPKPAKTGKRPADAGASLTKTPVRILKSPRVTEKAAYMTVNHTYVFEVAIDATKRDVIAVIQALYGVKPRKVNMVRKQPRAYVARFRNRRGQKAGMKKAYVFLNKDDKIDLV
jgi:large subunit ribosomal protein L23